MYLYILLAIVSSLFQITDNYCPDGLVYEESSNGFAKCSFPFSVDCEGRPELQPPKPTRYCPRQNGYFAHEDPTVSFFSKKSCLETTHVKEIELCSKYFLTFFKMFSEISFSLTKWSM